MLFPQLLDDLRAGGGLIAEHAIARAPGEFLQHFRREAIGVSGHGHGGMDAHEFPVPGDGILALGDFRHLAVSAKGIGARRHAGDVAQIAEAERLHVGQVQSAEDAGGIGDRIAADVAVFVSVGQLAHADAIQDDDDDTFDSHKGLRNNVLRTCVLRKDFSWHSQCYLRLEKRRVSFSHP